jgi:hypothetical protein
VIDYYWTGGSEFWLFTLYDKDETADLSPPQTSVLCSDARAKEITRR